MEGSKTSRPTIVTIVSILVLLSTIANLGLAFGSAGLGLPDWMRPFSLIIAIGSAGAFWGLWKMRRWGFFLYTALVVVNQIAAVATNGFNAISLVIGVAFVAALYKHFPEMK